MSIGTILVGVDGSDNATRTADFAIDLAQRYDAKLIVLNVVSHMIDGRVREELRPLVQIEHLQQSEYDLLQKFGWGIVDAAADNARKKGIANVETMVEIGDPAGVIIDTARDQKADLIVVGRRGLGSLNGLLLGSVAHKVSQMADRPCATVS